jgi:hypothetical protein
MCGLGHESRTTNVCMMCGLGHASLTTNVCLCFSFPFDDHGLSMSLNHGWNLLSSLHHRIDDDLNGVFRYTHTGIMCVHVNGEPL